MDPEPDQAVDWVARYSSGRCHKALISRPQTNPIGQEFPFLCTYHYFMRHFFTAVKAMDSSPTPSVQTWLVLVFVCRYMSCVHTALRTPALTDTPLEPRTNTARALRTVNMGYG